MKRIIIPVIIIFAIAAAFLAVSAVSATADVFGIFHDKKTDNDPADATGPETSLEVAVLNPLEKTEADTAASETAPAETTEPAAEATTPESETEETTPESSAEETTASQPSVPEGDKKYIALTFDDGPDMRYTSSTNRILDILESHNVKATFFIQALQLTYPGKAGEDTNESFEERNKRILKRAYDLGMEIGTHSYDHPNLNTLSESEIKEQFDKSVSLINETTGGNVKIMRPPYGNANETVRNTLNVPLIGWDVDSLDWKSKDPDQIYDLVMSTVKPGSIILMHDIYSTTADAVERVVPALIDSGYELVTVSELFEHYGLELNAHNVYLNARGALDNQ